MYLLPVQYSKFQCCLRMLRECSACCIPIYVVQKNRLIWIEWVWFCVSRTQTQFCSVSIHCTFFEWIPMVSCTTPFAQLDEHIHQAHPYLLDYLPWWYFLGYLKSIAVCIQTTWVEYSGKTFFYHFEMAPCGEIVLLVKSLTDIMSTAGATQSSG